MISGLESFETPNSVLTTCAQGCRVNCSIHCVVLSGTYLPTCTCSSREFDFIHVGSSCLDVWGDKMLIGARMLIGMVVLTQAMVWAQRLLFCGPSLWHAHL